MDSFIIFFLLALLTSLILSRSRGRSGQKLPPGPWPIPILGNLHVLLGQIPHRTLAKLAKKYGPIMSLRLGQVPSVVVSSPKAAELFLKKHDAIFASRPIFEASILMSYGAKGVVFTPSGDYWRQMRRMCTLHLLSPAKVASFEGERRAETEATVQQLMTSAATREAVDVGESVMELTERMMFKMLLGKSKEEYNKYDLKGYVKEGVALARAFNLNDFVPFLAPLDLQGLARQMKDIYKEVDEIFENIIGDHLKTEDMEQHKDILAVMLALMNNPKDESISSFDRDSAKAILFDLFVAGIETSSVTITWALSAILKYPRVMKLVREELDTVIGKDRTVLESDLSELSYLDMVIKETLRLYPPAPWFIPHESTEEVSVDGYTIPKNSRVVINFWAIGRDPDVWTKNAEEFYPERFMEREIDVQGRDFEFIPFGGGRRGCPGTKLGLVTVKLVVAQLIHCFNWELPNGLHLEKLDMDEEFGATMRRATQLLAIPTYRLTNPLELEG